MRNGCDKINTIKAQTSVWTKKKEET